MNHSKRLKQTHLFSNVPTTCAVATTATVYSWTFVPPFDHVLKGCFYFGQTSNPLVIRTQQHKTDSHLKPTELGLHALWRQYPHDDHWHIQVVETRCFVDRIDACDWMNAEERRLIDENGGVLRDMEKVLNQTLNLTKGGQGNSRVMWDALVAESRRKLTKTWPKLKSFYETHGHLRVLCSDPDLGGIVHGIRAHKHFLQHSDFKAWLDDRNFVYDLRRAHLDLDVWPKFRHFYETHGHLHIPWNDPNLGKVVCGMRSQKYFLQHTDFAMWLWCACFRMHMTDNAKNRSRWEQVFSAFT